MASPPTADAQANRVIGGRFATTRLVGEGTFAHVYRARDLTSGDDVAIKVLKEALRSDPEIVERFRREVFAVASIDSPHVVRMRDFGISGDSEGEMFIAMEYVEGPVLRDLLGDKPLSPDAAHIIIGQIAQAVAAAHDKGIIHRDLKPENIVLVRGTRGRHVKVLDFGLAKIAELEQRLELAPLTKDGMCFGTPQYMSPEQIQGRSAERGADLWALAVMAYEIIAGHLPWDGDDDRDVFYAVLGKPLEPIAKPHPSLVRLEQINLFFAQALSPRATERPATAAALFGAFEQALFGGPYAPAATVFSGIISAEFALPVLLGAAATEPGEAVVETPFAVTPDSTAPGSQRTSSSRRRHSTWSAPVPQLPATSGAAPADPAPAPPPLASAVPSSEAPADERRSSMPQSAATIASSASTGATAEPTVSRGRYRLMFVVLALLLVIAGLIGYLVGTAPR